MCADFWDHLKRKDALMRSVFDALLIKLKPDVICDVGSFNGDEGARFAQLLPSADIVIFEASPINMKRYILCRDDLARTRKENLAVSNVDGEATFYILKTEPDVIDWRIAASSLKKRTDGIAYSPITVPSVRLDSYFAREIDEEKTFGLWIDVEGALDLVLAGASNVLYRTMVLRTEVERLPYWKDQQLSHEIVRHITDLGFILLGDTYTQEASGQSDALFLNKNWIELSTRI